MPQMLPYTLELQWNTAAVLIGLATVVLACYVLPLLSRIYIARTHLSH